MAVEFKVDHTRTSEYLIDPADIVVKPELNGRKNLPEIDTLIESFVTMGQLQPVLIGRDGGKPVLYDGHRRWRAGLEINKRKLTPKPFKLRCVYYQGDEKAAFLATVVANHERAQTDEIDDANNIAIMGRWGMSEQEIGAVYHRDAAWVKKRLALLELCDEGAQAVRDGRLKPTAAVAIAKLSKEAQREKIRNSGEGKITAPPASQHGHARPRKVTEIRQFWKPYAERAASGKMSRFAAAQVKFIEGGDADEYFRVVSELLGEK
jgi:ParB-like chromosome segregation protein Spo0J